VATLTAKPGSILSLYRRLIALRRHRASLHSGDIAGIHADGEVLVYERRHAKDRRLLVALNLGGSARHWVLPADAAKAQLLLSTELDRDGEILQDVVDLRPAEGVILEM
jgi:alpha-glucosidase